jgi:cation diffusion facilitator CzcD-associated flavoprotein CzcO
VIVIGAGLGGLAAARMLTAKDVDVTVFERNSDIGGTWFDNNYPGAGVDVPSHMYMFSEFPGTGPRTSPSVTRSWAVSTTTPSTSTCGARAPSIPR